MITTATTLSAHKHLGALNGCIKILARISFCTVLAFLNTTLIWVHDILEVGPTQLLNSWSIAHSYGLHYQDT